MERITVNYDSAARMIVATMMRCVFAPLPPSKKIGWVFQNPSFKVPLEGMAPFSAYIDLDRERVVTEKIAVASASIFYKGFPFEIARLECLFEEGIFIQFYEMAKPVKIQLVDKTGNIINGEPEVKAFEKIKNLIQIEIGVIDGYLDRKGNKNAF